MAQILIYGYSNTGKAIANNLEMPRDEIIIADNSSQACKEAKKDGFQSFETNLTYDSEFRALGIGSNIKYLFCVHDSLDLNLFIILTSRMLDPNLTILAIAQDANHRTKLLLAGANETMAFEESISCKMATMITDKKAFNVYEGIFYNNNDFYTKYHIVLDEFVVSATSIMLGKSFSDIDFSSYDIIPLGFYSINSEFLFNIDECDHKFIENEVIIMIGKENSLKMFKNYISKNKK